MKLEEKVIELYEQVVIQAITPNQARKQFMSLLHQVKQKAREELGKVWFGILLKYQVNTDLMRGNGTKSEELTKEEVAMILTEFNQAISDYLK